MKVEIRTVDFKMDNKLKEVVDAKLLGLERYFDAIVHVTAFFKLINSGQVRDKEVEIIITVPRETIISHGTAKSFEKALDHAIIVAKRNITKYKEKLRGR